MSECSFIFNNIHKIKIFCQFNENLFRKNFLKYEYYDRLSRYGKV